MSIFRIRCASVFLFAVAAACAQAVTLDFSSFVGDDLGGYDVFNPTLSSGGFNLSTEENFARWTSGSVYGSNSTGTSAIFCRYRFDSITLSKQVGGPFDFISVDIANLFTQANSPFAQVGVPSSTISTIVFTGTLLGGGTTTRTYTTTHDDLFHQVNLNMYGVTSVSWIQSGNAFHQFNNVLVTPYSGVPEPASVGALAIGGIALMRRRKSRLTV